MMIQANRAAIQRFIARYQEIQDQLPDTMQQAMNDAAQQVADELKDAAPVGHSSSATTIDGDAPGPLASSFAIRPGDNKVAVVSTQPHKLGYVTQGTGLYGKYGARIVPVTKKALYWPDAQHPVRSVQGQKPNDFVTPVIETGKEEIKQAVKDAVIALFKGS